MQINSTNVYSQDYCLQCGGIPSYNEPSVEEIRQMDFTSAEVHKFYYHPLVKQEGAEKYLPRDKLKQWKYLRKKLPIYDGPTGDYNRIKATVVKIIDSGWQTEWDSDFIRTSKSFTPMVSYEPLPATEQDFKCLEEITKLDKIANSIRWVRLRASEIVSNPDIQERILSHTFHFPVDVLAKLRLVNNFFRSYIDSEILPYKGHEIVFFKSRIGTSYEHFMKKNWPKEVSILSLKAGVTVGSLVFSFVKTPIPSIISGWMKVNACVIGPGAHALDVVIESDKEKESRLEYEGYIQAETISKKCKFQKYITPNYQAWKVKKCLENLTPPDGLEKDERIERMNAICPISLDVTLFPATDPYGGTFDFPHIRQWVKKKEESPLNRQPLSMNDVRIDIPKFYRIHEIIKERSLERK